MQSKNRFTRFSYFLLPTALFFVLPIPHTIALRDSLAVICVVLFLFSAYRDGCAPLPTQARLPLLIFFALLVWLVVAGVALSPNRMAVLDEIGSQWLRGLIFMGLGGLLALQLSAAQRRIWLAALFGVLIAHVLYADVAALLASASRGEWAQRVSGLTAGPDRLNLLQQLLVAFLLTESLGRLIQTPRALLHGGGVFAIAWLVAVLGFLFSSMRNGLIALGVYFVLFLVLLRISGQVSRRVIAGLMVGLFAVLVIGGAISWRSDPRWQSLIETIPLALDTQTNKAWLGEQYPLPRLANGEPAIHSNYLRIAWIKEGVLLVREHPLGIGFERGAFGRGLQAKYGEGLGQHSHSGLLDLTIGGGIPALVLWLAFLAVVFAHGLRAWTMRREYSGALLVLIVADFAARSVIDSVVRDYMLLQFLFLTGTLFVCATAPLDDASNRPATTA
mgnify:CR=1 FL=1